MKCEGSKETDEYVDTIIINNFMPTISFPIQITSRTSTLIDHIFYYAGIKTSDNVKIKAGNFAVVVTDHYYILLINSKHQEILQFGQWLNFFN